MATIEESDRLIQTFNALLMIARIEAGPPDGAMTEVEAGAIVRDVVELYEPVAEEKGVELEAETPEPITLKASRELLGQALANLIDNAIKHGLPEGAERPLRIVDLDGAGGQRSSCSASPTTASAFPRRTATRVLQRFVRLEKSRSTGGQRPRAQPCQCRGRASTTARSNSPTTRPGLVVTMQAADRHAALMVGMALVSVLRSACHAS